MDVTQMVESFLGEAVDRDISRKVEEIDRVLQKKYPYVAITHHSNVVRTHDGREKWVIEKPETVNWDAVLKDLKKKRYRSLTAEQLMGVVSTYRAWRK